MLTSSWSGKLEATIWCLVYHRMSIFSCCYKKDCPHPRCKAGPPQSNPTWYPGGPSLSQLPLPIPDPERPWGSTCSNCKGFCSGHYKIQLVDVCDGEALSKVPKPPSAVLKQLFSSSNGNITENMIESAAKKVLLPYGECRIWLSHLQTVLENRRRGAKKAAATRRAKRLQAGEHSSGSSLASGERDHGSQVTSKVCVCMCVCLCVCAHACVCACACIRTVLWSVMLVLLVNCI